LSKYLRDVAGEKEAYSDLVKWYDKMRSGVTAYSLGLNYWVAIRQVFSLPFAPMYMNPKYLAMGMADEAIHPIKSKDAHREYSPDYRAREQGGYSMDMAEAVHKNSVDKNLYGKSNWLDFILKPTKWVDKKTVSAIMSGAVRQAMDEFQSGELSNEVKSALGIESVGEMEPEEQLQLAYKFADEVINRTQPQFDIEFQSQWARSGSLGRWTSMFSSFTNQELNMWRRAITDFKESGNPRKVAYFAFGFASNVVGMWFTGYLRDKMRGRDEEDINNIAETFVDSVAGMYFGIRDIEKAVRSEYQDNVELPMSRIGESLVGFLKGTMDIADAKTSKQRDAAIGRAFDNALDLIMIKAHLPLQARRTVESILERTK